MNDLPVLTINCQEGVRFDVRSLREQKTVAVTLYHGDATYEFAAHSVLLRGLVVALRNELIEGTDQRTYAVIYRWFRSVFDDQA